MFKIMIFDWIAERIGITILKETQGEYRNGFETS